jgi:hypothetical protein
VPVCAGCGHVLWSLPGRLDASAPLRYSVDETKMMRSSIFSHLNRRFARNTHDKHHRGQSDAWKIVRSLARIVILQFVAGRAGI